VNRRQILAAATVAPVAFAAAQVELSYSMSSVVEPFRIATQDVRKVQPKFRRQIVEYQTSERPGTVVVDTQSKFLYLVLGEGRALRYGIGVGREGFAWSGTAVVGRKARWPRWTPPKEMVERDRLAAKWKDGMPGGPESPLGARALYLFQGGVDTQFRIHGTFQPQSIGAAVSSGCIRLLNVDVVDLYERIPVGAKVVVLPPSTRTADDKPWQIWWQRVRDR
jgi:lipoprotein-anchoring transpeptidase ErfK/SrfK